MTFQWFILYSSVAIQLIITPREYTSKGTMTKHFN